ncbi:hypothetical protein GCM10025879_16870 [Leuconostoc litchii]|uniref:DUF3397 family protein n=1 Tax=Leuconostoc litchii TaxID=1981069 RepID=A0A6P2CKL4_9LACO|nr:DUF3397 family protein [Leuconostoc litchii]TYC46588.1 DUF3397 family protein [Leuconostoc litchii]GMA70441.1 hypothetical protein GCM10025879_16870 [Leuconostoc litchii]
MEWWFWPVGGLSFWLVVIILKKWTLLKKFPLGTLDIVTLSNWIVLHQTMGYIFGVSYITWILISWLVVGMLLAWVLLQRSWRWQFFWHRYWQWSGMVAAVLFILLTIIGLFLH